MKVPELGMLDPPPPPAPPPPQPARDKTVAFTSPLLGPLSVTLLMKTCKNPTKFTCEPQDPPGQRLCPS
jgi:hypothetical protein